MSRSSSRSQLKISRDSAIPCSPFEEEVLNGFLIGLYDGQLINFAVEATVREMHSINIEPFSVNKTSHEVYLEAPASSLQF